MACTLEENPCFHAVGIHDVNTASAALTGTENNLSAGRGPGRVFIVCIVRGHLHQVAPSFINGEDLISSAGKTLIRNFTAAGRPGRRGVIFPVKGDSSFTATICIHDKDLRRPGTVRYKCDFLAVRRPGRRNVNGIAVGQAFDLHGADIQDINIFIAVFAQRQQKFSAVRREGTT